MKLISLNKYISLFFLLTLFLPVVAEEQIDIWNKENKKNSETELEKKSKTKLNNNNQILNTSKLNNNIQIEKADSNDSNKLKIFGIYDPEENDFNLNMWSRTDAQNVRSSISRINKLNLSTTAEKLFEITILSFSYPPKKMDEKEFLDLKIDWMINNKKTILVEKFLKQNDTFHNKKKVVQYLVDENIAKANLKEGCEKIGFIDKSIKDPYLEKFKIYCLIFNNKKNEAQLLYDILREQNQSDKFFDDKANFLLGISNKTTNKINDDNLLNFYLSSITIENFKYEPKKNTKKVIWEYLNSANLIKVDNFENKEKIKKLELAANKDQFEKKKIFDIYRKIPFDLNNLIDAENIYQTLDGSDARALIYQKFLLSDNVENKVQLLFLLKNLFKKDNLSNVYTEFMSDRLKEIDIEKIPDSYKEAISKNIIKKEELKFGKIKYDDKVLHKSRVIKYYTEDINQKKAQKNLDKIYKKIKKNKKYFFSAKDLALIESFVQDGFEIPKELNYLEISKKYDIPSSLLQLTKNNEPAFLTLKIVEIIGEDEIYDLDPETIYFITHLFNQINLKKLRNEILISALPQRT